MPDVTTPARNRAGPVARLARRKQWRRNARKTVALDERPSYLARSTVAEKTAAAYISAVLAFEFFCRRACESLATLRLVDGAMEKYFTHCFFDGAGPAHGRNVLYGWLHLKTDENNNKGQRLPKASRALRGWNKRCRGHVRDPLPWCFVCLIAEFFLQTGKVLLALAVLLQVDTYLRPSELLAVTLGSFSPPTPLAGRDYDDAWTLVIAPAYLDVCTKTGLVDCSVLIGDKIRQFLLKALVAFGLDRKGRRDCTLKKNRYVKLFPFSLSTYEKEVANAGEELKLKAAGIEVMPHVLRHTGPSHDRYVGARSAEEVRRRGQWVALGSCARYEKHAKLLRVLNMVSDDTHRAASTAEKVVPSRLIAALSKL